MSAGKILTKEQAKAVADAMAYLNNINGRLHVRIPHSLLGLSVHVQEGTDGVIQCWLGDAVGYPHGGVEEYAAQHAFLVAYGITHGLMSVPLVEAM